LKLQIINSLPMQWQAGYKKIFPDAVWSANYKLGFDITLWMWCDEYAVSTINAVAEGKNIVFVRRYEIFSDNIQGMNWAKVDKVITVNDYLADLFENRTKIKAEVIYNGIMPENWTYKERKAGKKIAIVGFINQKKNIPLALQIMAKLPRGYELHIAGGLQDSATMVYMDNFIRATGIKVVWNHQIPAEYMNRWLEDKDYLLSTAISEGCPNNVIEAMAKGIKPVIHNWPGAEEQFGEYVFNTVEESVSMILSNDYNSQRYRQVIIDRFGKENYRKVLNIVEDVWKYQNLIAK
jgi:glycosyltransferase involved in cell wall biosynthesis